MLAFILGKCPKNKQLMVEKCPKINIRLKRKNEKPDNVS
jgi:hypothetical protein